MSKFIEYPNPCPTYGSRGGWTSSGGGSRNTPKLSSRQDIAVNMRATTARGETGLEIT